MRMNARASMTLPQHIKQAVLQGKKVHRFSPGEAVCFSSMNGQVVCVDVPTTGYEYQTPLAKIDANDLLIKEY
jgi:hypothetical protein